MNNDTVVRNLKNIAEECSKYLSEVRVKLQQLEDVPKAQSFLGKYYKSLQTYSIAYNSPKNKKWYVYKQVIERDGLYLLCNIFERDHTGRILFDNISEYYTRFDPKDEITKEEYLAARAKLINELNREFKKRYNMIPIPWYSVTYSDGLEHIFISYKFVAVVAMFFMVAIGIFLFVRCIATVIKKDLE